VIEKFQLKVLSYNIHKGFNFTNRQLVLDQIKKSVESVGADLLLLQEVAGQPITSQFEFIADRLWPHFAYGKNSVYTQGHHGNAILSRYPILAWENVDLSQHRFESRGLLHTRIEIPNSGSAIDVLCTHLGLFRGGRARQASMIADFITRKISNESPLILGGDFNDWTEVLSKEFFQSAQLREAFESSSGSHAQTFPSWYPLLKLDRLYYRNFELVSAAVHQGKPWNQLSDHLPMTAQFEFKTLGLL
jgi:endonuclease/exonuclease/phosphatase family metal-dependent hydrolase